MGLPCRNNVGNHCWRLGIHKICLKFKTHFKHWDVFFLSFQETDKLEEEKSTLQKEIAELQKQKDKLELILDAHQPICKVPRSHQSAQQADSYKILKEEKYEESARGSKVNLPRIELSSTVLEPEALHTPTLMKTPSITPFTPNLVFTYPGTQESCSTAHRRLSSSSSGGDQSPSSSSILTL